MGRRNASRGTPQRSRLIADKEKRSSREAHAFALLRPVLKPTVETIHENLRKLQHEDDIPKGLTLFSREMHVSIIQERRVRKGLARGLAAGFAIGNALSRLERGLVPESDESIRAKITGVDAVGRNRGVLIAHLDDDDGVLRQSRLCTRTILSEMGLKIDVDKKDHITLGTSNRQGLTETEKKHVLHTALEVIIDVPILLGPVEVDHNEKRSPLGEFVTKTKP